MSYLLPVSPDSTWCSRSEQHYSAWFLPRKGISSSRNAGSSSDCGLVLLLS